jgi:CRP-like cAMP-binding protein
VSGTRSRKLRNQLQRALERGRFTEALGFYDLLERMEPEEPRWPHRKGDLLKRLGRLDEAVDSFIRAVDLYAQQGFVARAAAMAKVAVGIDPNRQEVLARVNADAARELHRSARTHIRRISADALPLVAAPQGDVNRFTQPPTARRLELHLSDAELGDPPEPAPGTFTERPPASQLALLPSMPLFAEVPQGALARLVRESQLVELGPGSTLIERGTTADAFYVLLEGSVQLVRPKEEDCIVLSEGDVVGISCLLDHVTFEGHVTTRTKVRALRVSKLLLDQLVQEHPVVADVMLEILGRRLVATLLRTSPMFNAFDAPTRSKVASMFGVRRATMGTNILEAGMRADGLYIPMIGKLVAVDSDGEVVGELKLGRALGQHSMLTGQPSTMTVRAASDVLVLRLSARRFGELVAKHPKMVAHLEELARRPSSPSFSIVPGPQRKKGA